MKGILHAHLCATVMMLEILTVVFVGPAAVAKDVVSGGHTKAAHDFVDAISLFRQLWGNLFTHLPCGMVTTTANKCKLCHAA